MAAVTLVPADLSPFATIETVKAEAMIVDAMAMAARVAPCITSQTFQYDAAARAIIRGAILRWHEAGTGAMESENIGPYGYTKDTRQIRRGMFWPSEITDLQELCSAGDKPKAFSVDTAGVPGLAGHADVCSLNFGALYCSCGADLTGGLYPLYETPL